MTVSEILFVHKIFSDYCILFGICFANSLYIHTHFAIFYFKYSYVSFHTYYTEMQFSQKLSMFFPYIPF